MAFEHASDDWLKDGGIDFELTIVTCFLCLEFIVPCTRELFTPMETPPLPVKGYKC